MRIKSLDLDLKLVVELAQVTAYATTIMNRWDYNNDPNQLKPK